MQSVERDSTPCTEHLLWFLWKNGQRGQVFIRQLVIAAQKHSITEGQGGDQTALIAQGEKRNFVALSGCPGRKFRKAIRGAIKHGKLIKKFGIRLIAAQAHFPSAKDFQAQQNGMPMIKINVANIDIYLGCVV